jgi:protein required for attachment to host cells
MTTWILVANSARARLLSLDAAGRWSLVREFEHSASRAHDTQLVEGRLGTSQQTGGYGRPAYVPQTTPHEVEAETFAHELTKFLGHEYDNHAYERLVIVAGPHFLGLLRALLAVKVATSVFFEINKDLSGLSAQDVIARVSELTPV